MPISGLRASAPDMTAAIVTVAVPSFNQGQFLEHALRSIFEQDVPVEVFVIDGGSTDNSLDVIRRWEHRLAGWRSHNDRGQAAAINEGIARGGAPFVCWLNSDDWFLPDGLRTLLESCNKNPTAPAVYGRAWNVKEKTGSKRPIWTEPFSVERMAVRCIVSQPATLVRRSCWEGVNGLDESLHMVMDYDLWWRLYRFGGPLCYVDKFVAVNREHELTKTSSQRRRHYREAITTVRKHYGRVPLKWWLAQPYAVWYKGLFNVIQR